MESSIDGTESKGVEYRWNPHAESASGIYKQAHTVHVESIHGCGVYSVNSGQAVDDPLTIGATWRVWYLIAITPA